MLVCLEEVGVVACMVWPDVFLRDRASHLDLSSGVRDSVLIVCV